VISNISQELLALNTGNCAWWNGVTYIGTIFGISFEYDDSDGNGHIDDGATVYMGFDITPWSTFTGNGYVGSVTANRCVDFGDSASINVTARLRDGAANDSNSLTINIPKPIGYDNCFTQRVRASGIDAWDADDTRVIELGQRSGTFQFDWDTGNDGEDRIIVFYQGARIFDTGCVENFGSESLSYSGSSTEITVAVEADCSNPSGNASWEYTVNCP
jgi:hypothetical protein